MERMPSPKDFVIELPSYKWDWRFESAEATKKYIMDGVRDIVNRRFDEMQKIIEKLPRTPNKRRPEHYTWVVQHQVQGISFQAIAGRFNVSPATVKNEVMELKKLLGLSLPKGRRRRK
jgi:DNA-binding NarL/FixJ family response regulator